MTTTIEQRWKTTAMLLLFFVFLLLGLAGVFFFRVLKPNAREGLVVRPTPSLLRAIRELARLETAQVQVEKIVDLRDKQSKLFGLVESEDALLLVAIGRATVGVDFAGVSETDVKLDQGKTAHFTLPKPRVLDAALDETATYVYYRKTGLLAERNEQLESAARQQAVRAIEKAANDIEVKRRAKESAERQLGSLARALGAEHVQFHWK